MYESWFYTNTNVREWSFGQHSGHILSADIISENFGASGYFGWYCWFKTTQWLPNASVLKSFVLFNFGDVDGPLFDGSCWRVIISQFAERIVVPGICCNWKENSYLVLE